MSSQRHQVQRHLKQLSQKVHFEDSDFHKVQPLVAQRDPPSGKWGGVVICVEVARKGGQVAVRDSKNTRAKFLRFSNEEWKAFLVGAKAGQFDV